MFTIPRPRTPLLFIGAATAAAALAMTGVFAVAASAHAGGYPPPTLTYEIFPSEVPAGQQFSWVVEGSGSPLPVFSIVGELPDGVTFYPIVSSESSGYVRAELSGTPTDPGTYPLVLSADNGLAAPTFLDVVIIVVPAPPDPTPTPTETPTVTPTETPTETPTGIPTDGPIVVTAPPDPTSTPTPTTPQNVPATDGPIVVTAPPDPTSTPTATPPGTPITDSPVATTAPPLPTAPPTSLSTATATPAPTVPGAPNPSAGSADPSGTLTAAAGIGSTGGPGDGNGSASRGSDSQSSSGAARTSTRSSSLASTGAQAAGGILAAGVAGLLTLLGISAFRLRRTTTDD